MVHFAEWRFGIDHPVLTEQLPQEPKKCLRLFQMFEVSVKAELLLAEKALQSGDELATKDAAEYFHRKEERVLRMDPTRVVRRQTPRRYHAMHVGMSLQILSPCVEHAEEANLRAKMFRIGGDLRQRLSAGLE